jgi:DNA primase
MSDKTAQYKISAVDIIHEAIAKYGGKQKQGSTYKLVICPFHSERNPSCSVNFSKPGYSVGTFKCWSCNESGGWNKFAEKTGLPTVKKWQQIAADAQIEGLTAEEEQAMMGVELSSTKLEENLSCDILRVWKDDKTWRGFKGKLLRLLDCKLVEDRRTEEMMLLFPVYVNQELVGGVKAVLEKTKKTQLSYITSKGPWVKEKGLFPFDYVKKMLKRRRLRFVILVEGPRDALRLISAGLPAIAILGANNFSVKKAIRLLSIGLLDVVFTMPDNDEGGDKCHKVIKEAFKGLSKPQRIRLPRNKNKAGEIIKLDPMSAPPAIIRQLKDSLRESGLLPERSTKR